MPTGTKIVAIVLVVLLGVAGLYYVAASPSSNTSKSSAAKESGSNSTSSGTSVGNTPPTLTLTPGVPSNTGNTTAGGLTTGTTGTALSPNSTPTPTGAVAGGASRPQPPFVPGAASPSGVGKSDGRSDGVTTLANGTTPNAPGGSSNFNGIATNTTGTATNTTGTVTNTTGAVTNTTGAGNATAGGTRLSNGINRSAPGTTASNVIGNGTNVGGAVGGPTPTGTGLPMGTVPTGLTSGTTTTAPGTATSGATSTATERTHVIASGDTFEALAQKYYGSSTKWQIISKANPTVEPERLKIGQKIRIPSTSSTVALDVPSGAISTGGASRASETTASSSGSSHVVAKGDTLSSISRKYFGSDKYWRQILAANKGTTEKNLKIGQKLVIPARETVAGAENTGRSGG